ncbi:MAG: hypothetical protein H8E82_07070 [Candidatus Marinimicrobia bacterium]|nr:hypothetical protein [Candidatus Neomarinimicrobiota bacterium]
MYRYLFKINIMKDVVALIPIISIIVLCCTNPTEPSLDFSKMEVHYTKYGGKINTSKVDIYSSGLVNAYHIAHASLEILDSASTVLSMGQQKSIAELFEPFSTYDSYYEPNEWYTDGDYHVTVLIYEGSSDTVTVYEPKNANIPKRLSEIIQEMESLWEDLIG